MCAQRSTNAVPRHAIRWRWLLRSERGWRHKGVRLPDHCLLALARDAHRFQAFSHFRSMWFVAEFPAESSSSAQHAVGPGFRCVITLICHHMLLLAFEECHTVVPPPSDSRGQQRFIKSKDSARRPRDPLETNVALDSGSTVAMCEWCRHPRFPAEISIMSAGSMIG
jgi:hypothetical protein